MTHAKSFVVGDVVRIIGPITLIQTVWNAGGNPYGFWQIKKILRSESGAESMLLVMLSDSVEFVVPAENIVLIEEA